MIIILKKFFTAYHLFLSFSLFSAFNAISKAPQHDKTLSEISRKSIFDITQSKKQNVNQEATLAIFPFKPARIDFYYINNPI